MLDTANSGLGDAMDVDELRRTPSQESDDLYFSDSDTEFADAESDIRDAPHSHTKNNDKGGAGSDQSGEGSSGFDIVESPTSGQTSNFEASQEACSCQESVPESQSLFSENQNSRNANSLDMHAFPGSEGFGRKPLLDLVESIPGLYRILDLITERGSGGLGTFRFLLMRGDDSNSLKSMCSVDKVIIDQESTGRFINRMCPGACKDLTKVDFKALDVVDVKPVGVYGSKREIVRFLSELRVLDDELSVFLHNCFKVSRSSSYISYRTRLLMMSQSEDVPSTFPSLRAGLYALLVPGNELRDRRVFVIFWPEETTWNDNAISSVRRNRITFIRSAFLNVSARSIVLTGLQGT